MRMFYPPPSRSIGIPSCDTRAAPASTASISTRPISPRSSHIITPLPGRQRVQVFYDPKAPTIAYLETRRSGGAVFLLLFGGLFAVMGLGALVLVALVA